MLVVDDIGCGCVWLCRAISLKDNGLGAEGGRAIGGALASLTSLTHLECVRMAVDGCSACGLCVCLVCVCVLVRLGMTARVCVCCARVYVAEWVSRLGCGPCVCGCGRAE